MTGTFKCCFDFLSSLLSYHSSMAHDASISLVLFLFLTQSQAYSLPRASALADTSAWEVLALISRWLFHSPELPLKFHWVSFPNPLKIALSSSLGASISFILCPRSLLLIANCHRVYMYMPLLFQCFTSFNQDINFMTAGNVSFVQFYILKVYTSAWNMVGIK